MQPMREVIAEIVNEPTNERMPLSESLIQGKRNFKGNWCYVTPESKDNLMMLLKEGYTINELSNFYGISYQSIRAWVNNGVKPVADFAELYPDHYQPANEKLRKIYGKRRKGGEWSNICDSSKVYLVKLYNKVSTENKRKVLRIYGVSLSSIAKWRALFAIDKLTVSASERPPEDPQNKMYK